jgi:hypothetical protein
MKHFGFFSIVICIQIVSLSFIVLLFSKLKGKGFGFMFVLMNQLQVHCLVNWVALAWFCC